MRQATDYRTLASIAATIGLAARRGRTVHPCAPRGAYVSIAEKCDGITLDLHTGGAERETAMQMVGELEENMSRYGIEYEAIGALYEGGAMFYEWRIV